MLIVRNYSNKRFQSPTGYSFLNGSYRNLTFNAQSRNVPYVLVLRFMGTDSYFIVKHSNVAYCVYILWLANRQLGKVGSSCSNAVGECCGRSEYS